MSIPFIIESIRRKYNIKECGCELGAAPAGLPPMPKSSPLYQGALGPDEFRDEPVQEGLSRKNTYKPAPPERQGIGVEKDVWYSNPMTDGEVAPKGNTARDHSVPPDANHKAEKHKESVRGLLKNHEKARARK